MKLVLFDVDGTLLEGLSAERRFVHELWRKGLLGPRSWLSTCQFILLNLPRHGRHVLKKNKGYLAGLECAEVERRAEEFVRTKLTRSIFAPCRQRLEAHVAAGDHVALLTGTPHFIARPLAAVMGVEQVLCTRCAHRDGRFSAAPPTCHPFHQEKVVLARSLSERTGHALTEAVAYADSIHDLPLLEAVGQPVAVSPDRRLTAIARERGWEILGRMEEKPVRRRKPAMGMGGSGVS